MTLHDELGLLADTAPRPSIDHSLWDRGRALRRRDRLVTSALVLVMVVILGGLTSLVLGPPRTVAPADDPVPGGAIPSAIHDVPANAELPLEKDLAIGQASVAFISGTGLPVVISATDGRYHLLDLPGIEPGLFFAPAVSPDGTHLAWADPEASSIRLIDFETGDLSELDDKLGIVPAGVRWSPDGETLSYVGTEIATGDEQAVRIDLSTGKTSRLPATLVNTTGYASPDGSLYSVLGDQEGSAAFMRENGRRIIERAFPTDIYPDGVAISTLGWASDHLVLATADAPVGGYVEGRHLILFTSPDRPKSEWTFLIVARDLPPVPISLAVDLIPDLDGTSSQQLTHDFGEPDWASERDISWLIGLGVAGTLTVLYGLRWLWRRRTALL